ncbi:hypothetical protein ACJ73_02337 [Blastomyces percursus]|uniref:Uncharacterized protein n=1 Tax=Blastomyces percursus TaxID=1658174 RepID=A0A1J9QCL8_9EURO|nr:hypothetical protein ACJ73_02337 [Blastomyces percursus]
MTSIPSIPDDAPTACAPIDPLTPASSSESVIDANAAAEEPLPYFRERPPSVPQHAEPRELLQHTLTIYPRSQPKGYHRFPKSPAASQAQLPRKLRAEIQRDRKDCAQEGDDERQARIEAACAEWNGSFFLPRSTEVLFTYVSSSTPSAVNTSLPKELSFCREVIACTERPFRQWTLPFPLFNDLFVPKTVFNPRRPVGSNPGNNSALAPEVSTVTAQGSTAIPFPTENYNYGRVESCTYDQKFAPAYGIADTANALVNWASQFSEPAEQDPDVEEDEDGERGVPEPTGDTWAIMGIDSAGGVHGRPWLLAWLSGRGRSLYGAPVGRMGGPQKKQISGVSSTKCIRFIDIILVLILIVVVFRCLFPLLSILILAEQELRILRISHKPFRSTKRANRGTGARLFSPGTASNSGNNAKGGTTTTAPSHLSSKEAHRTLKKDIQNTKKEFRMLVARIK